MADPFRAAANRGVQEVLLHMPENQIIRRLLEDLRGGGFNTSLTVNNFTFTRQKVVAFENGVVYTVSEDGTARATLIADVQSVDF